MKTKLKSKKWKSLVSGILLAASASSFLIAPVFAAEYTDPLTGYVDDDLDIFGDDGNTVKLDKATNTIIYDFQGQDHTFTVENDDGITASQGDKYSYIFNNVGADGSKGTLHIYQSNNQHNPYAGVNGFIASGGKSGGKITVNSNLDITATSDYASVGVAVANGADLVINGNVKMRKDDPSNPWGIITKNVHGNVGPGGAVTMDNGYDANYTGARWQPSAFSVGYTRGNITVNGDVDVAVRGTAVNVGAYNAAEGVHPYDLATVSLVGDSTRIITPYREKNSVEGFGEFIEPYYSLACYGGTINVNVKNMEAQKGKVEIVGNIMAMKRSEYTRKSDVYQDGRINLALTTSDSSWKGIIDNTNLNYDVADSNVAFGWRYDPDMTPVYADHSGEVNLWLQNGAQWIYENASRKDGLDYSHMPQYSQSSYGNYDGMSHLSRLVGGKDSASAGIIRVNDNDPIQIAEAEGVTKVWYEHADATPGTIIGGDVKVLNAKTGTEMMLYTGNNGITKGFAEGDTAAEKNNVSEVLNSLAHKLWYMAGDSNLTGSVSIAEGLTASSATMKTGNITFAEGGQGFYEYTPAKDDKPYETGPIVKSENIDETRVGDVNGVVSINVTEAQDSVAASAPSAMYAAGEAEGPLVVDLQGHTLKLNANNQTANYVSTVYVDADKSMEIKDSKGNGVLKVSAGLGADGNADTKANYVYGIRVGANGSFTANTDVEIDGVKSSATQRAYGVYVSTKGNVVFEKDLTIKNVQTGNKVGPNTAGIYADSSSSADAPINITVKGNLNIENVLGSAIRALNTSTISTGGATIKAADMSNGTDYSQYYALQANKGTINLNTGEGITAGILDVTGDMKVTDNKASVINVNMTKGSQWTGAVSNIPGSTYNAPAGQFNLTMAEGSVWNHETGRSVDTLKTTFAGSNVSKLDGSGVIYQKSDKGITVYNYSGDTTVVYGHDAENPLTINGGNFTVKTAAAGSKITLVTDSQGINAGFEASDTAAEKNNVKEILNKLANKLFYTGYKDANLAGVVKIADGLTASSVSATVKASGDVTFSDGSNGTKTAGQGFYDYTPEQEKPNYKTGAITKSEDISLSRELDESGVAHVAVTESNVTSNFASAIYAGESTDPSSPMTVKMSGKGLALNAAQSSGQAAAIYAGANTYIKVINPSAEQKLSITANNTDTRASHGIYALGNAHLNISGPVEITDITTKGDAATGINIQGQQSEINIDGPLTISNVKGLRERGKGMSASGILVTGDSSAVTVSGPVDISGVRGSGIKLVGANTKVSVGGGTITAAEDSDKSHNFYAVRVDKGTLDINMKDGSAGDTTTKITGDMYATGQYGKKVVEYTGGELIDWKDAGILNVALTDKDSFWKGVAAYDQYNDDYGSGGNTAHDIGQFNLYLQNGAAWTNEQQSHVTTTTIASKNPVWTGSTLATLHGGKDADNAGLIYQKDNNPISVVNYSGHTTVFYDHDAADPTKIIGGSFNITNAAEGSAITFITDNKGITSGFADGDSADAKDKVANVLNSLAGKLFYKNYTDGHLAGVVKIAEGLTASSAALKTGDISFSTEETGTFTPGQGYYDYKTSKPGSQITKEFTTAITGDAAADTVYIEKGVLKDDGTYVFTADSTTITPEKHLIAGGAYVPQIGAAISGSDENHNVTIEMNGNKLTVDTTTDTHTTGIAAIGKGVVNINNAGAMSISAASTRNGQTGALFVNAGGTINIHNAGADNVLTLRANSTAPANAAVIKSMNGVGGVMSTITVDGLVDIVADKSNASGANEAISAVASKVEVGGGVIKAINGAEYAIRAYGEFVSKNRGQVNVNVKKDAEGAIIGAGSNNVQLEGNIYLGGGMDSAGASADVSVGLNTKDSFWKGDVSNTNGSSKGIVNLYMGNGATWTGNNLSGNTVNANLDNATWTGYSNGNAMHLKLDNSIWNVNGASKLASFSGNKGSIFVASDAGDISVADYSGNTTVIYNHDADNPTNILGGSFTIGQANTGSNITLITDNQGITKGFYAYDKAEDQNTVNEVLNKLAQKLFYTANDGKLAGTVKIASGLTASSAALKTGDISFSTDATGTNTPGQGFYEYTVADDSVITDPITGNLDKKYVNLGIETEKGIYNFTQDTVINVTKGDYSSNLSAIESSGGPITINADGKNLDVSYHVLKGSNVARAVATGLSYGKSKDITIKADSLKLSTDTTGFYGQGVYATGGKITIDADTTISTSAQTESNGIYSGSGGTVTMNGNLDIQKDSNAANYIALKSDDNGVINVNMKDGKAGAGIVKIDGDVFTKSAETYDYWEDETTSTSSTVNLALQGKDSSWNGRSLYEVTSGDDSTSYGTFNLWLTDGAAWTNEKNGKEVPSGFTGSHVTNFTGGSDAAHAGNIFQNDTKKITIENYSGNTNIYYAHTGNGEAAGDYKAGDTVIKHAEKDSVVSLITDNSGVNMSSADSIVNVLNSLAGKLTYSNFTKDENNLTGYVKIADGLTSSSAAMYTGDMAFSKKDGKGSLKDEDSIRPDLPAPDHQIKNEFTTTLTGVKANDKEYYKAGVIKSDGLYQFTENSSITTTNAHGADMNQATTIDAKGKTLTFNTNVTDNSTIHAIGANSTDGVTITADKLVLNAHSTKGRVEAINVGGQGQQNKDKPMKLTINGDTEMNVKGINYALGLYAAGNSEVTFNGNVTAMGDENSEWGLTSEKGAYGYYGCSLVYSGSNYTLQTGPKVTINGDVNAKIDGNCLFANGGHAKLTINGGGNIEINKDNKHTYYAMMAESGTTSMNVNLDANYDAISARDNKLVLKGNVGASTGAMNANEPELYTKVNLGLATADSVWTGVAHNGFKDEGNKAGDKTFYGAINVFLQNGATWNNEKWGETSKPWGGSGFVGSHVAKFVGGSDAAHAGNIFQNDANNITIDNYSGNTNIFYAHTGNGEAAENYAAGDTVIRHAEKDSVVSLITDNSGVNMSSADSIVNVLNSLAGKLTYSNFTKDENNLTGYVKIADGLTSSSAAMYTGDMAFSKKDGKGSLKDEDSIRPDLPAPDHQIKNEFTTTLTGVKANDKEYYKAGVIKSDGLYQFTENSSITTTNAHGADMNQATTIDAKGKTLTFNTNVTDNSTIHAIGANSTDGVTITADKLVLNAHSTKGRVEAINVGGQGQQNKDKPMKLTINGDTEMNVKGINYALGLYAAGNSEVTFNGNVTAMGDENSEWGLTSEKGAYGYYGCSLVYSGSNYTLQTGPKVTINGDVNAKIDGNCLFANGGHAKLTINGGGNIEINKDNKHTYYAMMAESGTTSMNVNLDANYDAISARDNKLVLKGNVGASTGAMNANEPELYTKVNLGLATADSVWTGVAHNGFKDEGNKAGDKTFYGAINVFLQNGATWNNEKWGETSKPWGGSGFVGSHVAKFVGGSDAAHAGNIFQNDANNITIDNYSGNTNIFYAHTGNGEAAENYAAGDTVIRHAEKDSVVSLITDNSGIAMDNEYSVTNVLNTLAGKLTYSKFVNGEKNLAGYVKIADGLTASSAAMQTGNIAFNAEDGKGSLENGSMKPGFTYPETQIPESNEIHQGITGDGKTDYQYKKDGILKEDGTYVFTQDPTKIEVESGAAVEATDKDINIDTTKAKLELKGETGIKANGADVTVNGNTGISGATGIDAANGNVTLNGNTTINANDGKGNAIKAGEGGSVTISGQNGSLNGAVNINGAIVAEGADSKVSIDSSKATGIIEGNVTASNGGNVEITLDDANSQITGSYNVDDDSSIVMNIKNGAVWNLTDDDDEVAGMSLLRMAKAPAAAAANGLTVNGGAKKAQTGYMDMTKRTKDLKIASYSGWETIIYGHENAGDKDEDYKSGDTIINKAAKDSGVILSTDNSGINMDDKAAVEATLKALAHKVTYTDHEANGSNLTGMVQIADGLTASSASKYLGDMSWDENGKGQYVDNSIEWKEIYNGNYETLVMKGVRSAATTSMHSWRDNMQDTYTGADLTDEDGIFAKALGGKTSSDVKGVKDSNTYRGVQVGLDKALANGWHAGVAFDYRDGDSNYLLGGKGDNQLYSFGVYGVKNFEDQSYLRVAAKAGRVENEYDVYNEIRTLKLHGDYKANAYGLTMEYGKTFGTEASYFTPKAQLTWSQVGAKDYTAHTPNDSMRIDQDAYSSLVARFGVEAGAKSEKGHVYVGLYGAHEFNGDITASYFAKDGGYKHTSFDGKDTWMEMSIGGSYDLSDNCHIYADFAKDFGGDFERKWKASAGLRFEF
ncbi:autotransporter outer membrane beta-barrel domain-containing protein [Phascolarctobacterium succinatutens]|uniref:autotransporter outer membrane beta-barrel domain-containing protein n=1 Tax=Phascolarctobacterium succinatutens TaxID=626940 RepID=UPI0023FA3B7C|nr:autotransporter outer membrane beta-barrel domain-containing protein [Phascolarctobacterium succinatutens]